MDSSRHTVTFYGLSTCIHCRHAREFLEKHSVPFELHYVDQAEGQERAELLNQVKANNPSMSFPTIIIDDGTVVVGFQADALSRALEI